LGWAGEEIMIPKLTIISKMTLNKKLQVMKRINKLIKALNSQSFDKAIWLKGWKGEVFIDLFLIKVFLINFVR